MRRPILCALGLVLALVGGLVMVASASGEATVARMIASAPFQLPSPAPVPGQITGFPYGSEHSAFPTITQLPDGRIRAMWRHGSQHISPDGEILTSVSADNGLTWSVPQHVTVDNGGDTRDPHLGPSGLSTIDGDVFLTYFVSVDGVPTGARVARSTDGGETFEPSVRIDPNYPWAAISSPIVRSPNGKLWAAFYAKQSMNVTYPDAYIAHSTDNGQTWTSVRIAIGDNDRRAYAEPWIIMDGTSPLVFFRDGTWNAIAMRTGPDGGPWPATKHAVIPNATGNNAVIRASNGRLYMIYRHTVTRAAMLASSGDNGVTWTTERTLMEKPRSAAANSVGMTYAHPFEWAPGQLGFILGMEFSNTVSRLYLGYV